jgi:hypothetical protein
MSIPTGQGYIPLHVYNFSVAFHKYILSHKAWYMNLKAVPSDEIQRRQ